MERKLKLDNDEKLKMDHACKLYKEGNLEGSLPILNDIYNSHPKEPILVATLANLHWDIKKIVEAIELFHKAVDLDPNSEKISRGLFHILWEQGEEEDAVKELQRFINTNNASEEYVEIALEINEKRNYNISI